MGRDIPFSKQELIEIGVKQGYSKHMLESMSKKKMYKFIMRDKDRVEHGKTTEWYEQRTGRFQL